MYYFYTFRKIIVEVAVAEVVLFLLLLVHSSWVVE
jgi:hypothetical protein